ncbi:MAG: glycoside hydrolase [Cyanobacteria bacterium RYN_339]|nr:glycoside hydrolase [Cyanobacteria bacterium RYN_339]
MTRIGGANTARTVAGGTPPADAGAQSEIDRFLAMAMRFQGEPYRWGGGHGGTFDHPGPVDCSGLVSQAAKMTGIHLEGTAASLQGQCQSISKADLKPGDLVFNGNPAHHVGIYIGNGQVLHAPHTGDVVRITSVDHFQSAGRPRAFGGQTGHAVDPGANRGDENTVGGNQGDRSNIGLPQPPIPPSGPVPAYRERFGQQGYVRNAHDASLVNLAKNAVLKAPELAGTQLAEHAKSGKVTHEDVVQLQRFLEAKGFSVGNTGVDGMYGPRTHAALAAFLEGKGPDHAPTGGPADGHRTTPTDDPPPPEVNEDEVDPLDAALQAVNKTVKGTGKTKDGHEIPAGAGRATVFANGHIAYKGWSDAGNRQNNGIGAWGDKNAPTEYFCALPVGLQGGGEWWHNQKILVTNPANGQQVVVRVQDKGPAPSTGNAIDLSPVAMEALGGKFNGAMGHVRFEFAPDDAPVGPVKRP